MSDRGFGKTSLHPFQEEGVAFIKLGASYICVFVACFFSSDLGGMFPNPVVCLGPPNVLAFFGWNWQVSPKGPVGAVLLQTDG